MQANEKTIIGVDHGYAAIKTAHCVFPTGLTAYNHEPYTRQDVLEYEGKWYVCGTGRQPVQREKMANDTYYLLTLAAIARELERRRLPHRCTVALASGLPLTSYGRQKGSFKKYLLRSPQPVKYRYEGEAYEVTVEGVWLYPQGYSALAMHPDLIAGEPSFLLMDIGGWTVDMMRLDNGSASAGTCRSLELGMIRCLDEAREQVLRDTGLSLTDAQIERVLSGQPCSMDEEAHRKGRTSAGKDAAGNPHGHPANRTRGETGGTAGKAGCKSCAENSKGGRTGAGQYCQSLYCGGQKSCSCAGGG